jgi:hypothetical protein
MPQMVIEKDLNYGTGDSSMIRNKEDKNGGKNSLWKGDKMFFWGKGKED